MSWETPALQHKRRTINMSDFIINHDNVLVRYQGPGGHIRVPDGV